MEMPKKLKAETKAETTSTVTFVEGSGGLEKSKSDSKLNQVSFPQLHDVVFFVIT